MEYFTLRSIIRTFIFMLVILPKVGDERDSLMNDHKCAVVKEDGFNFYSCINDRYDDEMAIEPYSDDLSKVVASTAKPEEEDSDSEEEDNDDEEVTMSLAARS
ncbi:hypothetical protein QYM36_017919 [Artemia franciscana]|uniref:Uncharacterized protein n=1 Tax=Artemia franciscana TaxID=6661 RepID=A0AA88KUE4_ARTSF|nr:hypothetical protein QYM36_017919 [Artemia franciscana]